MTAERLLFLAQSNHTPLMCEHLYKVDQNCHSSQHSWALHWWKIWKKESSRISSVLVKSTIVPSKTAVKELLCVFVCLCWLFDLWNRDSLSLQAFYLKINDVGNKVLQLFGLMSLPYTDVFCWPHSLNYLDYNNCCVHTLIIKSVFP